MDYYFLDKTHPQYVMPLHWHNEIEIIRIVSGTFRCFLNHTPVELKEGDVIVIGPGVLHRGEPVEAVYECAVFDLSILRKRGTVTARYLDPIINSTAQVFWENASQNLKEVADRLFHALKKADEFFEFDSLSALYDLFGVLYKSGAVINASKESAQIRHRNQTAMQLLDWCEEHFSEEVTLKKLSEASGLSEKYLCRFFKEYTGITPIEHINRTRIEHAVALLLKGVNVTEAAMESGFNDLSYFSKIFKRYKGVSPSAYRRGNLK